jgi:hypothetical protein
MSTIELSKEHNLSKKNTHNFLKCPSHAWYIVTKIIENQFECN